MPSTRHSAWWGTQMGPQLVIMNKKTLMATAGRHPLPKALLSLERH